MPMPMQFQSACIDLNQGAKALTQSTLEEARGTGRRNLLRKQRVGLVAAGRLRTSPPPKTTEAVLSKVDLPQKDVLANIRNLTAEVRTLGNTLREMKTGERPALQPELAQLEEALTVLNVSVDRLVGASQTWN